MKFLRVMALGCGATLGLQGCVQPEIESANERGVILIRMARTKPMLLK